MTISEKIGQLFMIGFYGTRLPENVREFIRSRNIGFVILFSRNIESISQVQELTAAIHRIGETPPLIYTDQEGGGIVRFGELAATAISAMGLAATGNPQNAWQAGNLIGRDMKACGIDGIFAPVLDVNVAADNPVIGIRAYADEPETVIAYATQFMHGVQASGILTCGKHYPGHGAAVVDSHLEIPEIPVSQEFFNTYCLSPFRVLARSGIDGMMTSHVRFPLLAPDIAGFSPYLVQQLLRDQIGFNGVVFSDCLEMKAVRDHFSPAEIVEMGINAGLDVFVPSHSLDFQEELLDRLESLVIKGIIPEKRITESVERILALRARQSSLMAKMNQGSLLQRGIRENLAMERQLAAESVTLLRNDAGLLPLQAGRKVLLLEWQKTIVGPSIMENDTRSMVGRLAREYLEDGEVITLKPEAEDSLPDSLEARLTENKDEYLLAFIYSRAGQAGQHQTEMVQRVLTLRPDTIIISLETPYEIKKYPGAATFLVTYGFRMVQVEALFQILTGKSVPTGKLPVEIAGLFPRGFGLGYDRY